MPLTEDGTYLTVKLRTTECAGYFAETNDLTYLNHARLSGVIECDSSDAVNALSAPQYRFFAYIMTQGPHYG